MLEIVSNEIMILCSNLIVQTNHLFSPGEKRYKSHMSTYQTIQQNTHIHSILSFFLYHIHILFLHTRGKGRDLVIGEYFCLENFSE